MLCSSAARVCIDAHPAVINYRQWRNIALLRFEPSALTLSLTTSLSDGVCLFLALCLSLALSLSLSLSWNLYCNAPGNEANYIMPCSVPEAPRSVPSMLCSTTGVPSVLCRPAVRAVLGQCSLYYVLPSA